MLFKVQPAGGGGEHPFIHGTFQLLIYVSAHKMCL
jgi:hypothetical protein